MTNENEKDNDNENTYVITDINLALSASEKAANTLPACLLIIGGELNGTIFDMERLVTTPKKTPKGPDNRAVRIRINNPRIISDSSPLGRKGSQPNVSNKNSRYDMFPAEKAFSVLETKTTVLSAFELIEQEGQKEETKLSSSRVKNITPTVTPGPTVYNDNYHTSSGGVSLNRPSVQRSHSRQPPSNNSSNSKDSDRKSVV